jgi:hypothetical protein
MRMSKEARDRALADYWEMHALWRAKGDPDRGIDGGEAKRLRDQARVAYFDALPLVPMSRCPLCGGILTGQFDPFGFDGFWWQERELGLAREPEGCQHFRVLTGAVALGDSTPRGGEFDAHIGPDVPFVVPAVLELPTMVVVVSSLPMETRAMAYPIVYFSSEPPPPGSLTATWRETSLSFVAPSGQMAWTIKNDPWDFDLRPWIPRGKLRWIMPGTQGMELASPEETSCPYLDLPGQRRPQIVKGDGLRLGTVPNPRDEPDPFTS